MLLCMNYIILFNLYVFTDEIQMAFKVKKETFQNYLNSILQPN